METRAHYILIGLFTLVVAAAVLAFGWWISRPEVVLEVVPYETLFETAVEGLRRGGEVRFNGIKVGDVAWVRLDVDDPRKVRVRMDIEQGTPIKQDSTATLGTQGLTGVSFVEITGGTPESPMLLPAPGEDAAIIPSELTGIDKLKSDLPQVLANINNLLERIADTVNETNRAYITRILEDVEQLTGTVADDRDAIAETIENIRDLTARANDLTAHADTLVAEDVRKLVADAGDALATYNDLGKNVDQVLADARPNLDGFLQDDLGQIKPLLVDLRRLVVAFERIAAMIERDPSGIIFGDQKIEEHKK
jgi:phospholipid/cholesterol/gamma-HCH transport system substrate-binding protein